MTANRLYIIDTNVLIHDPESIFSFKDAHVGIPIVVLEELDRFKSENSDRGQSAREVIRYLDAMRDRGSLREGVQLEDGGTLRVLFMPEEGTVPFPLSLDIVDNAILITALLWKKNGYDVIFISKDINARVKADALDLVAEDYLRESISEKDFYKGWVKIQVPAVSLKSNYPPELDQLLKEYDITRNEYVLAESAHNPYNHKIFRYVGGNKFIHVQHPLLKWPLEARNPQQVMALDLLFDPSIQLISLIGQAGTGKTFMALLAGLHKVLVEDEYQRILISRPVVPLGKDIGFLPGSIEEKLHSWMQPIYDNMDFIVHAANMTHFIEPRAEKGKGKKGKDRDRRRKKERSLVSLDELIHQGKIGLEAITFMRGRSIPYQFILIDEVQNLTPHEVKTLISRVGEGSKIILAGDPYQIDSPYLDFSSNGLMIANDKFKGQALFGTVYLESSERSELSKLVGELW